MYFVSLNKLKMYHKSALSFISSLLLLAGVASAQRQLSEDEMVARALSNSRNIKADSLNILQQKQLVKAAVNLPNPEFFWESPTGTFYTGSITQSMEFPTVYSKQRSLQKERVGLARKEKAVSESELKLQVKLLYMQLALESERNSQLVEQDSLYDNIREAAGRQFKAGQIDYLQQVFTETQYGDIHTQLLASEAKLGALKKQLQYIAALHEDFTVTPFTRLEPGELISSGLSAGNAKLDVFEQNVRISEQNIGLQRSKALPGLAFGYFNQGERETPLQYRFRFGLTIPLWFWQYTGNITAAKLEKDVNTQRTEGFKQQLSIQQQQLQGELGGLLRVLNYYENTALGKSREMITTAGRFFEAGEADYVTYLRNVSEAYNIRQKYLDALKSYNENVLQLQSLMGKL
jgi:outer membrane protein TolC